MLAAQKSKQRVSQWATTVGKNLSESEIYLRGGGVTRVASEYTALRIDEPRFSCDLVFGRCMLLDLNCIQCRVAKSMLIAATWPNTSVRDGKERRLERASRDLIWQEPW